MGNSNSFDNSADSIEVNRVRTRPFIHLGSQYCIPFASSPPSSVKDEHDPDDRLVDSSDRASFVVQFSSSDELQSLQAQLGKEEDTDAVIERKTPSKERHRCAYPSPPSMIVSSKGSRDPCTWQQSSRFNVKNDDTNDNDDTMGKKSTEELHPFPFLSSPPASVESPTTDAGRGSRTTPTGPFPFLASPPASTPSSNDNENYGGNDDDNDDNDDVGGGVDDGSDDDDDDYDDDDDEAEFATASQHEHSTCSTSSSFRAATQADDAQQPSIWSPPPMKRITKQQSPSALNSVPSEIRVNENDANMMASGATSNDEDDWESGSLYRHSPTVLCNIEASNESTAMLGVALGTSKSSNDARNKKPLVILPSQNDPSQAKSNIQVSQGSPAVDSSILLAENTAKQHQGLMGKQSKRRAYSSSAANASFTEPSRALEASEISAKRRAEWKRSKKLKSVKMRRIIFESDDSEDDDPRVGRGRNGDVGMGVEPKRDNPIEPKSTAAPKQPQQKKPKTLLETYPGLLDIALTIGHPMIVPRQPPSR
jgi:hypothetical protein